jgi:signal transduction histidine kinase
MRAPRRCLPGIKRVGFWRALIEVTSIASGFNVLSYLIMWYISYGWGATFGFVPLFTFAAYAWRLQPGTGSTRRRIGRVVVWVSVAGLIQGVVQWVLWQFTPMSAYAFGMPLKSVPLPLQQSLMINGLMALGLFMPIRAVADLHTASRSQLRWRLTFSYMIVGLTISILIPFAFIGIAAIIGAIFAPTIPLFTTTPQDAATALTPFVQRGASAAELNTTLQGMLDGSIRLSTHSLIEPEASPETTVTMQLATTERLILLRPDNTVLASTGPNAPAPGTMLPGAERSQIAVLMEQVRAGGCREGSPVSSFQADHVVCAILDQRGAPLAMLVAEKPTITEASPSVNVNTTQVILIVLFGGLVVLLLTPLAMIIILPVAGGGVGYLLAGRLTRRLERLAAAAGDVAAGNLARRVEVDSEDEVGHLANDFNTMAVKLAEREHALAEAAQRAEALLRANKRLVADVSHELRTPLTTMRGYLEVLAHEHGDKLPEHDLVVIEGEMQRLTALIEDLFTLARAESHQLPLQIEPTDIRALAANLIDTLAPLARRERQVEVIAALPDALPLVCADRARLEQVLLNMLQNALRYTPAGGIVAVEAAATDAYVTLAVADTGMGIEDDELPHVWERFYRSDRSRARETGGAGLGLALVHELVTAMGGTVGAESTPGRGSRFSIRLRRAG